MSRSYHKVFTTGICTGSNGWYYENRRHQHANAIKHEMRNLLANYDTDEIDDLVSNPKYPKRNTWDEPTDGRLIYFSLKSLKESYKDWDKAKRKQFPKIDKKCSWR